MILLYHVKNGHRLMFLSAFLNVEFYINMRYFEDKNIKGI